MRGEFFKCPPMADAGGENMKEKLSTGTDIKKKKKDIQRN